jgi:hypothetical protein
MYETLELPVLNQNNSYERPEYPSISNTQIKRKLSNYGVSENTVSIGDIYSSAYKSRLTKPTEKKRSRLYPAKPYDLKIMRRDFSNLRINQEIQSDKI